MPFLTPQYKKIVRNTGKTFIFPTCTIYYFLLAGHKADFISPYGTNKSILWPPSRKKIVFDTGKTFILLVWLLPTLCSGIKLPTRKTNFFLPSCTMYYFLLACHEVHFIPPWGANKSIISPPNIKNSCVIREKHSFSLVARYNNSCLTHDFFILGCQKMHLFALQVEIKCSLWHASTKKQFSWLDLVDPIKYFFSKIFLI